ncbi:hypothetical protein GIB67_007341 [Kingdonia uniflora]|uniref:Pentatricopeptide repeat-containing protein n=1 Tax=Kingdonia uniflora TaxID=39325 RepID=A0A7J7NXM1_9MAGN|nr:hypothetical protein GIB67_007341 [Kingdonia uniflora]
MGINQIHTHIVKTGFHQNLFLVGKIITFCAISDNVSMGYAVSVFNQIKTPDGFMWNTIIRGIGKTSDPKQAFGYYKSMLDKGEVADNFTYSFLLKICGQLREIELGKQIHGSTLKHGWDRFVFVRNTLVHMYGLFKDVFMSRRLFEEMPKPELVAWNVMIDCYVNCGKCEEAVELFFRMERSGIEPDDATLVVVLSACSDLGALDLGKWVHSCIDFLGLSCIVATSNALLNMYAKCGDIKMARGVFNKMTKRNIVSWNSMIMGLAMHGDAEDALELFSQMIELKVEIPDEITFMGVLCACSHGGLVDEGRKYFTSMTRDYCIQPEIKHYGCMVDLLGRAGFVEEAYDLIRKIPMKCNAIVWRALLSACRVHGKLVLGEKVRRHMVELEPDHSGDYVLLSHMYASEGRWNDMMDVRTDMKSRQVQKPGPGNALIDTNHSIMLQRKH